MSTEKVIQDFIKDTDSLGDRLDRTKCKQVERLMLSGISAFIVELGKTKQFSAGEIDEGVQRGLARSLYELNGGVS